MMAPGLRKLNFTAHLTTSVAWVGAVGSFLALSVAGLASQNPDTVRGAYVAMNLLGEFVIVPLSLAAFLTGLAQSLGTEWGLLRYYWVATKLVLTIGATLLLLLHQFNAVAGAARRVSMAPAGIRPEVGSVGIQLVGDAGLALVVLLVIATLGVYKPWGLTRYGLRKRTALGTRSTGTASPGGIPRGLKMLVAAIGAMAVIFALLHHAGGGLAKHGH